MEKKHTPKGNGRMMPIYITLCVSLCALFSGCLKLYIGSSFEAPRKMGEAEEIFLETAEQTTGVIIVLVEKQTPVTEYNITGTIVVPKMRYTVDDIVYEGYSWINYSSSDFRVGDELVVYYDSEMPEQFILEFGDSPFMTEFRENGTRLKSRGFSIIVISLIVFVGAGILFYIRKRKTHYRFRP